MPREDLTKLPFTFLEFEHTDVSAVMDEFMNIIEALEAGVMPAGTALRVKLEAVPARAEGYD